MNLLLNFDLFIVGILIAGIGILGFIIFFNDTKSTTGRFFLVFCLLTAIWGVSNYFNYQTTSPVSVLWILRLHLFISVCHSFFFFILSYVIPQRKIEFSNKIKYVLTPIVACISIITLTPLVFTKISTKPIIGEVANPERGPGMPLFVLASFGLIALGIFVLYKKMQKENSEQKRQLLWILAGASLTFLFIVLFNLILPVFFNNVKYIPFGAAFVLPFIVCSSYAIVKHKLLNVKVFSTEILVFALAIAAMIEVIISNTTTILLLRSSIFLLVLGVGIMLIRSVFREIKQREQLEVLSRELGEANVKLTTLDKARAEFISIASHQLRTPPATVKWFLSAILSGDYGQLQPETKEAIQKAFRTNNSLISLIDDMLNVSRIERGKMEFLFEEVNLQELADITFEQLQPIAQEKKLQLIFHKSAAPLPKLMADKEKLRQVMNNLIDNAIKYTKQGAITVELFQEGDNMRFQVSDTGKGIGTEEQSSIFNKYSRGKESIQQSAGLGLGLYVARVIIEQHKGKIWAESSGDGKGSKFIFTVPIHNHLTKTTLLDLSKSN